MLTTALKTWSHTIITQSWGVVKKKLSMAFVKFYNTEFIQGKVLQWGFVPKEKGLNFDSNKDKWDS